MFRDLFIIDSCFRRNDKTVKIEQMWVVLAKIFPLALGEMISPVVLSVMLVILSGKKAPISRATSFLVGMAIAVTILGIIGLNLGNETSQNKHPDIKFWSNIILAFILLALGIRAIFKKPKEQKHENEESAESAQKFGKKHLLRWFILGFALNMVNLSSIAFYFAATKEISASAANSTQEILLTIFCGIFFMLPIVFPVVITAFLPKIAKKILNPIHFAITNYGNYINMAILFGFGFYLLYKALTIYF